MHGCQNAPKIKQWLNPFYWKWMKQNLLRPLPLQADDDYVHTPPPFKVVNATVGLFG